MRAQMCSVRGVLVYESPRWNLPAIGTPIQSGQEKATARLMHHVTKKARLWNSFIAEPRNRADLLLSRHIKVYCVNLALFISSLLHQEPCRAAGLVPGLREIKGQVLGRLPYYLF